MASIAQALSPQDSADVSAYYEAQVRPASPSTTGGTSPRIALCGTCHNARGGDIPQIIGQQQQYLEIQLSLFAQGIRSNDRDGVMRRIVGKLTVDDIRQLQRTTGTTVSLRSDTSTLASAHVASRSAKSSVFVSTVEALYTPTPDMTDTSFSMCDSLGYTSRSIAWCSFLPHGIAVSCGCVR